MGHPVRLSPHPARGGNGRTHHHQEKALKKKLAAAASVLGLGVAITMAAMSPSNGLSTTTHQAKGGVLKFSLQRSAGAQAAGCLDDAGAKVTIKPGGPVEHMTIKAHDLVPNSE